MPIQKSEIPRELAVAALVLSSALFSVHGAQALSCGYVVATVAEHYANALGIVVAEVEGCADGLPPTNGRCPCAYDTEPINGYCLGGYRYHLNVLEVLKNAVPQRELSGTYVGGDGGTTSCGLVLTPGERYLLFVSSPGSINHSASHSLPGTFEAKPPKILEILRDYRDGKIDHLAGLWGFVDHGLYCELQHGVAHQQIGFSYPYEDEFLSYTFSAEYDEEGYATRFDGRRMDPAAEPRMEMEIQGPERKVNTLMFSANFDRQASTVRDSATIRVGEKSWPLTTQVMTIRSDGLELVSIVSDVATGADAHEILQTMLEPQDVVVRKRRVQTDAAVGEEFELAIETRTTHIGDEAAKFLACIDGTVRSRAFRESQQ